MRIIVGFALLLSFFVASCHNPPPEPPKAPTPEEQTRGNLETLKRMATNGDLVVRLTDDVISNQIRFLNETDKSYSHCGMIVERNGQKWVSHIAPEIEGADTIQYVTIDSFLNPDKNIKCAIYRYDFSVAQKDSILKAIEGFKAKDVRFDKLYDLATDDHLYCTEMISKAIKIATHGAISFKAATVPARMQKIVTGYFKQEKGAKTIVANRTYIPLDNLYLIPRCTMLMSFNLKHFPGQ